MDEGAERVQATYRDNHNRLARIKAATTPTTSSEHPVLRGREPVGVREVRGAEQAKPAPA